MRDFVGIHVFIVVIGVAHHGRQRGDGTLFLDNLRIQVVGGVGADGALQGMRNAQSRVLQAS